jgi:AraC-like DNA-binding protein
LKVNFSDWKNSARINHAKDLISNGQAKNLTLEAIALSCGYLSRSNFINAFKKYTGKNPSEFIKDLPEETFNKNLDF